MNFQKLFDSGFRIKEIRRLGGVGQASQIGNHIQHSLVSVDLELDVWGRGLGLGFRV